MANTQTCSSNASLRNRGTNRPGGLRPEDYHYYYSLPEFNRVALPSRPPVNELPQIAAHEESCLWG
jgi:hypothetical protein